MDIPNDVVIEPPMMDTALQWIGFDQEATRERLRAEGFDTFDDLIGMKEKDIRDLADSYTRRTVADGRTIFELKKTQYLIGLVHWVQAFARIGETPSLDGIGGAASFKAVLDIASYRADVRKVEKDQSDTVSKAADPGKFKNERKWPEWEPAFVNYLSTLPGVNGVPLSYVICESEMPDPETEYGSFNEQAVACAPLTGSTLQADSRWHVRDRTRPDGRGWTQTTGRTSRQHRGQADNTADNQTKLRTSTHHRRQGEDLVQGYKFLQSKDLDCKVQMTQFEQLWQRTHKQSRNNRPLE